MSSSLSCRASGGRLSFLVEYVRCGAFAGGDRAVHEPLEVDRGVLAAEMDVRLARAFVAGERRALADRPIRIRSFVPAVARPVVHERLAVPLFRDARVERLEPAHLVAHDVVRRRTERGGSERRPLATAGIE